MVEFVKSQYQRYSIELPPDEVTREAAWATVMVLNFIDPYAMLCGLSDVEVSKNWSEIYYEIIDHKGKGEPADPEQLETFTYKQGQDELAFNHLMAHPGLDAVPYGLGNMIKQEIYGERYGSDRFGCEAFAVLDDASKRWLHDRCYNDNAKLKTYFELGAWAALLWLIGPPGREFRYTHHHIFCYAANNGEAIMYEGYVIDPESYRKFPRRPESCVMCGIDKYCVELSYVEGSSRHMCEHHVNGPAMYEGATCGSRVCRAVDCINHPAYGQQNGLINTLRLTGQLVSKERKEELAIEAAAKKLLTN